MEQLLTGLSIGAVFLLVSLGLTIIYGSLGVINMAHGDLIMLGAYVTVFAQEFLKLPFLLCLPLAFLLTGLIGFLIERTIVQRLYNRLLDTLLATWGVGIIIQQIIRLTFGPSLQQVSVPSYLTTNYKIGEFNLQTYRLTVLALGLVILISVLYIIYRTDFGIRLRAATQNAQISACNGIDVKQVRSLTFALGAGLAGVAGVMVSGFKTVSPTMGTSFVVDSFIVVVVGGITSLLGTAVSSIVLGQVNSFVAWASNDVLAKAALFSLAIVIIRFRPQGLFSPRSR